MDAEKLAYVKGLFSNVLSVQKPRKLDIFLGVVQGSGYTILGKDEWRDIGGDIHPFIMPLARKGEGDDTEVLGLLVRAPNGSYLAPDEYQVVTQSPLKSWRVNLISTDMNKYIMKRAEEAAYEGRDKDKSVIEATRDSYKVRFDGSSRTGLDKWLLLEVGAFPDVYRNLAQEHIEGGDPKTGLVIADTMRDAFGTNWGFPHAYVGRVLNQYFNGENGTDNRKTEAEHSVYRCFQSGYPLWTLEDADGSIESLLNEAKMARLTDLDALRIFYIKRWTDDQRSAVRTGNISEGCAALAKAQALMDAVCCGHKSFNRIRAELRDTYDEVPGCDHLVEMIEYFRQKE